MLKHPTARRGLRVTCYERKLSVKTKQDVIHWLEANRARFTKVSDEIWTHPEVAFQEFRASKLQAEMLEEEGFTVTWDVGEMNTAFMAQWEQGGQGKPVIGFAGEYDALPGLSQKNQSTPEPLVPGGPGHGCGHNLLGTGCLASAVAVKHWLEDTGTPGTVRYYGCPAEEGGGGKGFMARAGAFDDLDAAFNFHPGPVNAASKGSTLGVKSFRFRFHGVPAHAAASPHMGRSALDAVELMNVGVNFLREHVSEKVRLHYVITEGGDRPNIVPATAETWHFVRAPNPQELEEVAKRVQKIAQGAAMMTETTLEETFVGANISVLNNHYLADLQFEAMKAVGPIEFTAQEKAYAQQINAAYPEGAAQYIAAMMGLPREAVKEPLLAGNFPAMDEGKVQPGSTDVGALSWCTPLSMLSTACWPTGAAAHSWGVVATGAHSIGHKGMMHAAKIMAVAAIDLYGEPEHLSQARAEFEQATGGKPFKSMRPGGVKPPQFENPFREF
jgi:aminobenzoyl-glutamate utilization protein B